MNRTDELILPENLVMDRTIVFKDITYKIMDELKSDTLLVVRKDDYDNSFFPIPAYIIPNK